MSEITNVERIKTGSGGTQYRYNYDDGRVGVGYYDPTKTDPAYRLKRETGTGESVQEIRRQLNRSGGLGGYKAVKNALTLSGAKPDMGTDYKALMDYAASQGDMDAAAFYESMRNRKIAGMDAGGTNTGGWAATDDYGRYYDGNMDSGYTGYLMKYYGRGPASYTDADMSRTVQSAIASLEAQGKYDEANAARAQWLYRKNYDTGETEQLAQPNTWSWSSSDYRDLSSGDAAARAAAVRNTGVYGGRGGTLGDYRAAGRGASGTTGGSGTGTGTAGGYGGSGTTGTSGAAGSGSYGGGDGSGSAGTSGASYASSGGTGSSDTPYASSYSGGTGSSSYSAGSAWPFGTGGDGGLTELYDASARAARAALERSYESAAAGYGGARDSINAQYYEAARKAQAQSDLQRLANNELFAANGLNTGAVGQAALAQGNALQNSLSAIDAAQAESLAEVDTSLAQLRADYEGAVAEAIANNEMEKASALYQRYQQEQERQLAWYQQLWQLNYQQELTKSAQAQSLAQQQVDALVGQGIMPGDGLIAASGYDRSYVQAMVESVRPARSGAGAYSAAGSGSGAYQSGSGAGYTPAQGGAGWADPATLRLVYPDGEIPVSSWSRISAAAGGEGVLMAEGFTWKPDHTAFGAGSVNRDEIM